MSDVDAEPLPLEQTVTLQVNAMVPLAMLKDAESEPLILAMMVDAATAKIVSKRAELNDPPTEADGQLSLEDMTQ